ncbi:MAG: FAD-binding oxidoreductase [Myxococcales bacterium]|nr:FAD-binding oxidoreductase [Myxococcales bacterium]
MPGSLRRLPRRVFEGFGYTVRSESVFAAPESVDELREIYTRASEENIPVHHRGAGRSYGDAAMNAGGLIVDMRRMNRLLDFDPEDGIAETEPGFTIESLWKSILPHGYWPAVVPGTMFPTLGGCAAMNIHGKNHCQQGGFGDAIVNADLLTPAGELIRIAPDENKELFRAAISGFGMLGTFTRIKLRTKRVKSGSLRVQQHPAANLREQLAFFEEHVDQSDYIIGWVDCIGGGSELGRGQIHVANYLDEGPDALGLNPSDQALPKTIMGVPLGLVGTVVGMVQSNPGMHLANWAKYMASKLGTKRPYHQAHVAFQFLLDYVPTFRDAYRPGGFIQYQPFIPREHALPVLEEILRRTQRAGLVSYLGVLKRYRPDEFLLSHALDGYSLAMDFPVSRSNRVALFALCGELSEIVLEAGGKFYPAKDSVMRPEDFSRSFGEDAVHRFQKMRREVDPARILRSDFSLRVGLEASTLPE